VAFGHTLVQSLAIGPDHAGAYRPGWDLSWLVAGLSTVAHGFVPLPDPRAYHAWNTSALDVLPRALAPWAGAVASSVLLVACARALRRAPGVVAIFAAGSATLLAITLFVWFGFARHHGQHVVWFLACAWIASALGHPPLPGAGRVGRAALAGLLGVHAVACAHALVRDLALPFSNARAVAAHLAAPEFHDVPLVGSIDYAVEPVTGYLDRPVWYPESDRLGTFLDWSARRRLVPALDAVGDAVTLASGARGEAILILSYRWRDLPLGTTVALGGGATIRYSARLEGAIVADENYHLYRVSVGPR
jgi:hypothetical protein